MSNSTSRFFRLVWRVLDYSTRPVPGADNMLRRVLLLLAIAGGSVAVGKMFPSIPVSVVIATGVSVLFFAGALRLAAELGRESAVRLELDPTNIMRRARLNATPESLGPPARILELMIGLKLVCKEKTLVTAIDFSLMRKRWRLWSVPVVLQQTQIELHEAEKVNRLYDGLILDALSVRSFDLRAYGFLAPDYEIDERHFLRIRALSLGHEPSLLDLYWVWDEEERHRESRMVFTAVELRRCRTRAGKTP